MKLQRTNTIAASGVKLLCYGAAGAGKTSLIPSLPDPIILSSEAGLLSIRESDLPFIEISNINDLHEAYAWLVGSDEASYLANSGGLEAVKALPLPIF